MRCPRHDLAIAEDGRCVRCRREDEAAAEAAGTVNRKVVAVALVAALVAAGALAWVLRPRAPAVVAAAPAASAYVAPSAPPLAPLAPADVAPDPSASGGSGGQTPLDRAMHSAVITFYSRPASIDCGLARTWLLSHGYLFKERDVDADTQARKAWQRGVPDGTVPAFDIDGQVFGGYDPARIQAALEYAGARRLQR